MARVRLIILILAFASACTHAEQPRLVFAHYMLANAPEDIADPTGEHDIASFQQEIREAQSLGIDGFALNAGGWLREPRYIRRASLIFEAAFRLHSGFVLFFSADMCCGADATDLRDMMRRFAGNPRYASIYFHHEGRAVLSTFSGSGLGPAFWRELRSDLATGAHPSTMPATCPNNLCPLAADRSAPSNAPLATFFVPSFFFGGELPTATDISQGLENYGDIVDGAFYWGIAGVPGLGHSPDQLPSSSAYAQQLHHCGKLYMAPISAAFWGANAGRYYSYRGFTGMEAMWRNAIEQTDPDWIEIITWNDFVEGTYITPSPHRLADGNDSRFGPFPSHEGTAHLMAYFIRWYKDGHSPEIPYSSVFWSYRTHLAPAASSSLHIYGQIEDSIYLTTLLTHEDTLRVSLNEHSLDLKLPTGLHTTAIPLAQLLPTKLTTHSAGKPSFTLNGAQALGSEPITLDHQPLLYETTGSLVASHEQRFHDTHRAMGTDFTLDLYADTQQHADSLFEMAFDEIDRLDDLLSNYKPSSELSRISREAATRTVVTDPETFRFLERSLYWSKASSGAFDITVGPLLRTWGLFNHGGHIPSTAELDAARAHVGWEKIALHPATRSVHFSGGESLDLDPGSIGKGFAVDAVVALLRAQGVQRAFLSAGSSTLYGLGSPPGEAGWPVTIVDPRGAATQTSLTLHDISLSTGACTEKFFIRNGHRYCHIFDPRTGLPVEGVLQSTVLSPSATDSDALSTVVFVLAAEDSARILKAHPEARALIYRTTSAHPTCVAIQITAANCTLLP